MSEEPTRVLFVCLGNIVRSPLGENLFRDLAEKAGRGEAYVVDSAGTASYHSGDSPDARMRQVAAENGLVYDGAARQFTATDFEAFDLIIAMDTSNRDNILRMARHQGDKDKVRLMRDFDPQAAPESSVPDPYYGGINGFYEVYEIVKRATQGLFAALETGELE